MFKTIQRRLLLFYLAVIFVILGVFATAIRVIATRSIYHQLTKRLTILGQGAAAIADLQAGTLKLDEDSDADRLINQEQALQWFDLHSKLVEEKGHDILNLPLSIKQHTQIQTKGARILAITVSIIDDDTKQLIGYVRASESLEELDSTLQSLDWGLGCSIAVTLLLSGLGGIWLTRQAMQPIEQSFQRLQQFTSDASHELRSPLMVIKSNTAVALKYPEGMRSTDAEKFQAIVSACSQMIRLTEDLLTLARTKCAVAWTTVELTTLLTNLTQLYQPQANAKTLHLKARFDESLFVMGNADLLTQLFTNLIENALHYTLAQGTIAVKAERTGAYLEISVQDTGVGIAPEHLNYIFDRFWRADQSRSHWAGGAGLGLAIAQDIAQVHKGKITVTSQPGTGSCFTVHLPTTNCP